MKKFIFLVTVVSVLGISGLSFAAMAGCSPKMSLAQAKTADEPMDTRKALDAGNKICPVSKEEVDEKLKATYESEGKIYNFCCAMCIDDFKKDPQKYITIAEKEIQDTKEKGADTTSAQK